MDDHPMLLPEEAWAEVQVQAAALDEIDAAVAAAANSTPYIQGDPDDADEG